MLRHLMVIFSDENGLHLVLLGVEESGPAWCSGVRQALIKYTGQVNAAYGSHFLEIRRRRNIKGKVTFIPRNFFTVYRIFFVYEIP
jgi:hypothetical protein